MRTRKNLRVRKGRKGTPSLVFCRVKWAILLACYAPCLVISAELNCDDPQTSEAFTRITDCTLSDQISLTGDMEVAGKASSLTTITSASTSRHFNVGANTLTLKWLKLTGGFRNVGSFTEAAHSGGSISITGAGTLNAMFCWFYSNKGSYGGSIFASTSSNPGPRIELNYTNITSSIATVWGGGIRQIYGETMIVKGWFGQNEGQWGGAMILYHTTSILQDTIFYKNTAKQGAGAIEGLGSIANEGLMEITRCNFEENKVHPGHGGHGGGGALSAYGKCANQIL
eukprot:Stramenopile-MAST_4_protein_5136